MNAISRFKELHDQVNALGACRVPHDLRVLAKVTVRHPTHTALAKPWSCVRMERTRTRTRTWTRTRTCICTHAHTHARTHARAPPCDLVGDRESWSTRREAGYSLDASDTRVSSRMTAVDMLCQTAVYRWLRLKWNSVSSCGRQVPLSDPPSAVSSPRDV